MIITSILELDGGCIVYIISLEHREKDSRSKDADLRLSISQSLGTALIATVLKIIEYIVRNGFFELAWGSFEFVHETRICVSG